MLLYKFNQILNGDPNFSVKDLDKLFVDFQDYKEQNTPTLERYNEYLESQGVNPEEFLTQKLEQLKSKRVKNKKHS